MDEEQEKRKEEQWKELIQNQGKYWGDLSNFLDAYGMAYIMTSKGIWIPSPVVLAKKVGRDFTECPKCGCDEALIVAVGILENEGKLTVFCPVCQKCLIKGKG